MISILQTFINATDRINDFIGKSVSWLSLGLVLLVCFDVVRRFIFERTDAWIMELQWHMFAMLFLLGAGYTLKEQKHVRVDLFYSTFEPRHKALINLIGGLVLLIPLCILLIYLSVYYAYDSYLIGEGSADPGGLPYRFIIKMIIPIGMSFLLLQGLAETARAFIGYKTDKV